MLEEHADMTIFMEYWPYGLSRNEQDVDWFFSFLSDFGFNVMYAMKHESSMMSLDDVAGYYKNNINTDTHINLILNKDASVIEAWNA